METKKCSNCQNEIPADSNLCPYCGTNMNSNINTPDNKSVDNGNIKRGLLVALLAIIGIVVMFAFRAWLGVPIYLVAFFIAAMQLRNEYEAEGGALDEFIKDCIKNKDIGTKLMTVVVLILPVVLIIGAYRWIITDSYRDAGLWY